MEHYGEKGTGGKKYNLKKQWQREALRKGGGRRTWTANQIQHDSTLTLRQQGHALRSFGQLCFTAENDSAEVWMKPANS